MNQKKLKYKDGTSMESVSRLLSNVRFFKFYKSKRLCFEMLLNI